MHLRMQVYISNATSFLLGGYMPVDIIRRDSKIQMYVALAGNTTAGNEANIHCLCQLLMESSQACHRKNLVKLELFQNPMRRSGK